MGNTETVEIIETDLGALRNGGHTMEEGLTSSVGEKKP